jgi:hypothetical protein
MTGIYMRCERLTAVKKAAIVNRKIRACDDRFIASPVDYCNWFKQTSDKILALDNKSSAIESCKISYAEQSLPSPLPPIASLLFDRLFPYGSSMCTEENP